MTIGTALFKTGLAGSDAEWHFFMLDTPSFGPVVPGEYDGIIRAPQYAVYRLGMLSLLTRQWRWRAASLLVAAYALCVVAPAAGLAFSNAATAVHYLTDDHSGASKVHVHQDGSGHKHSDSRDTAPAQSGNCCGLFCLSAIAPAFDIALHRPTAMPEVPAAIAASIFGRGSDRIDRPPRSLLSL